MLCTPIDARRKVSIDAFIFSPRSQTSDQILQKNIPKLGPKGDLWLQQEKILLLQQENILLSQQDFMSGSVSKKIEFLVAPLAKVPIGK